MTNQPSRRQIVKGGLALAGLGVLGIPDWALPALAQGETLVPFTDLPETINLAPTADRRIIDIRKIDGPFTPKDQFFTTQHYGHPEVDPAAFRLKVSGLVNQSIDALARRAAEDGQHRARRRLRVLGQPAAAPGSGGNGRWTGVPLKTVLDRAGVKAQAREFVFFGADQGEEEVEFRGRRNIKVDPAVRPQPAAREGAVAGAVPGVRAERRAAHASIRARRFG